LKHRRQRVDVAISGDTDLIVSVEDDGPGIPEQDQQAIFQRFVQLRADERPSGTGLGLGLAGVKALLQAMGGRIEVVSREGHGTRFSVRIPPLG
jgi:signal transduction histidine kinase